MSNQVAVNITSGHLVALENNIRDGAKMIKIASESLRKSYNIAEEGDGLKDFRAVVLNNAKIYQDKIVPFSNGTVSSIQQFCTDVDKFTREKFRSFINQITDNAQSNEILCDCTMKLNKAILVEFKIIENKAKNFEGKQRLDNKREELSNITERVQSIDLQTNEDKNLIKHNPGPLSTSIYSYIKCFENISGFFNTLLNYLRMIKKDAKSAKNACKIDENNVNNDNDNEIKIEYLHETIKHKAKEIVSACIEYINIQPAFVSDLDCIEAEVNNDYIDEWVPNEIKKPMYSKLKGIEIDDILEEICGF